MSNSTNNFEGDLELNRLCDDAMTDLEPVNGDWEDDGGIDEDYCDEDLIAQEDRARERAEFERTLPVHLRGMSDDDRDAYNEEQAEREANRCFYGMKDF